MAIAAAFLLFRCGMPGGTRENIHPVNPNPHIPGEETGGSKVYFTGNVSGNGLLAVYRALGVPVSGKVAIKLHMGEPGNKNFLKPELLRSLTEAVGGTFVDSNVFYGGSRITTAGHLQAARDHGFTYAPVDILDSEGDVMLPVKEGKHLTHAIVGAHILDYDWIISVAHFKGHLLAGYGGTFKNLAVGAASPAGKSAIHSAAPGAPPFDDGERFFEKIIEYNRALMDAKPGKILYINVLNNLSTDCDCIMNALDPVMADIGIMASLDPVALEKASLDQIYASRDEGRKHLIERIESRDGAYQIIYAEKMGLGSQKYELIKIQGSAD
ncbi:MAG: DUF362 domain-containing protein [Treponema sp.]|nr:DUF362 domain-containing protein [Treponema sp.]